MLHARARRRYALLGGAAILLLLGAAAWPWTRTLAPPGGPGESPTPELPAAEAGAEQLQRQILDDLLLQAGSGHAAEWVAAGLEHPLPEVVCATLRALVDLHAAQYAREIAGCLRDSDLTVRKWALWAVRELNLAGQSSRVAVLLADEEDDDLRAEAAYALGRLDARECVGALAQALRDPVPGVRYAALASLADFRAVEYADEVTALLHDPDFNVSRWAGEWLPRFRDRSCVPSLVALLGDPAAHTRAAAAAALGAFEAREHRAEVSRLLDDPDATVRRVACTFLGRFGSRAKDAPALARRLDDPENRRVACIALCRLGADEFAEPVARLLAFEDSWLLEEAIYTLTVFRARGAAPQIATRLDAPNFQVRSYALRALVLLDAREFAPRIALMVSDRDWFCGFEDEPFRGTIGEFARQALDRWGHPEAAPEKDVR